jgi:cell division protein FtsZ
MVDEKVVDQVWVTVVATGYGERPPRRASASGRDVGRAAWEADREPRVSRGADRSSAGSMLGDVDVPEFLPRG